MTPGTLGRKKKNATDSLRSRAEKKLGSRPAGPPAGKVPSPEELIHELQVHQVEMELQNEALRESRLALERSRDQYLDLYDFAPVGYFTLGKQSCVDEVNLTGASILRADRRELLGKPFLKFITVDDFGKWGLCYRQAMGPAGKAACELDAVRSDGAPIRVRLDGIRVEREGEGPVLRLAMTDITEQERTRELLTRRSRDLDALSIAYQEIADGKQKVLEKEARLTASLEEKERLIADIRDRITEQEKTDTVLRDKIGELSRSEHQLRETLEEKEILLSEIHHRVKNNLTAFISLLSLDGASDGTDAGKELRKDLQNRARSMALIHETLYRTGKFSSVNMGMYLTTLVNQVAGSYAENPRIRTEIDAGDTVLDISRATTAGLIINELVTNSFKYAFPGFDCKARRKEPCTIRVGFARDDGGYVLVVADNGRGLPEGFDPLTATSLGLKLVTFLARHQLMAEISVRTDRGTKFTFRLKDKGDIR